MILSLLGMEMLLQIKNQWKFLIPIILTQWRKHRVQPKNYVIDANNTQEINEGIIRKYDRHTSILKIKNNFDSSILFDFPKAEVADVNALLEQIDPKKATGPDTILPKNSKNFYCKCG